MAVNDGRQVSETIDGIREDHVNRYKFAASLIPRGSNVIDSACGIGYGSKLIAESGNYVESYDISADALNYALKHYSHERVRYNNADVTAVTFKEGNDVAVSFETIEHLEDPTVMLRNLGLSGAKTLIASVPNEKYTPFDPNRHLYHKRHYTESEFYDLLTNSGWKVKETFHQIGKLGEEAKIQKDTPGGTIIVIAEKE